MTRTTPDRAGAGRRRREEDGGRKTEDGGQKTDDGARSGNELDKCGQWWYK